MSLLEELKHDLLDPVRTFADEVYDDTVGDAKKFYTAQAKKARQNAETAKADAAAKLAELKRQQLEMQKRRRQTMKRAALALLLLAVAALVILSLALNHGF